MTLSSEKHVAAFCDTGNPKMGVHFSISKLCVCVCVCVCVSVCALMIPGSLKNLNNMTMSLHIFIQF